MLKMALCVFLGSGTGGVVRYLVSVWTARCLDPLLARSSSAVALFPWATFAVNVVGCFIIGAVYAVADSSTSLSAEAKTFLAAGFCGGLTTFSTFTHENYLLFESHNLAVASVYVAASLVVGLCAAYAGHAIAGTLR